MRASCGGTIGEWCNKGEKRKGEEKGEKRKGEEKGRREREKRKGEEKRRRERESGKKSNHVPLGNGVRQWT
jgi:hypothetical protein